MHDETSLYMQSLCLQRRVSTVEERLAISDLTPSTQYEASVVAVGKNGTSWPSPPITFMTYPLSNSGMHSSPQVADKA